MLRFISLEFINDLSGITLCTFTGDLGFYQNDVRQYRDGNEYITCTNNHRILMHTKTNLTLQVS